MSRSGLVLGLVTGLFAFTVSAQERLSNLNYLPTLGEGLVKGRCGPSVLIPN